MLSTHIIIVNYNSGSWLNRSVRSALAYSEGRVTIVDNASQDESVALAKQNNVSDRLDWIENPSNRGFAAANNQVLATLSADVAILLNPDCELAPDTLPVMLDYLASDASWGILSSKVLNEDGSVQATCRRRFPTPASAAGRLFGLRKLFPEKSRFHDFDYGDSGDYLYGEVEECEAVSGAFMVVRKSAIEEVGVLDEAYFMHCEDLDWCKRFHRQAWKVGFVADVSVLHAKGVSSRSRPVAVLWALHKGMLRFFKKFYQDESLWLRGVVSVGIIASFVPRAMIALARASLGVKS